MKNQQISELELNQLLAQAFLAMPEGQSEQFENALVKDVFRVSDVSAIFTKRIYFVTGSIAVISAFVYSAWLYNSADKLEKYSGVKSKDVGFVEKVAGTNDLVNMPGKAESAVKKTRKQEPQKENYSAALPAPKDSQFVVSVSGPFLKNDPLNSQPDADPFPVLTEDEIRQNEKDKKKLFKVISNFQKDRTRQIVPIPASIEKNISGFYMTAGEISNHQYRIFLFDLLIHGRTDEFLRAKPHQNNWINAAGQTQFDYLAKQYFSDHKYNDYPVVNVTSEGAEMFCRWINDESVSLSSSGFKCRLLNEKEWVHAAMAGRPNAAYSWPIDSIQNRSNCFMANCCIQKLKDELRYPIYYGRHKIDLSCYTAAGMFLRDPGVATTTVWSYNPSAYGLYDMCGNVSEYVYADDTSMIKTKGGNWASDYRHVRIDAVDEFKDNLSASPMIGFRYCIVRQY